MKRRRNFLLHYKNMKNIKFEWNVSEILCFIIRKYEEYWVWMKYSRILILQHKIIKNIKFEWNVEEILCFITKKWRISSLNGTWKKSYASLQKYEEYWVWMKYSRILMLHYKNMKNIEFEWNVEEILCFNTKIWRILCLNGT